MKHSRLLISTLLCWLFFQLVYAVASYQSYYQTADNLIKNVENRLALDLPKLRLANPRFNTVAHTTSVLNYMQSINGQLQELGYPLKLTNIQGIGQLTPEAKGRVKNLELTTSDRNIPVQLVILEHTWVSYFSFIPLLATLLCFLLLRVQQQKSAEKAKSLASAVAPILEPKLIINLHNKTIGNGIDEKAVPLSNKPFCFYIALLNYCMDNVEPKLNHNKNVPDELITLANKYFYRLIELGHTKRKRPDFSTNLDKTLSEIRAALDEVFHDIPEEKDKYYPPKAQGEGSRSKLHNYALEQLNKEKIEFIGK